MQPQPTIHEEAVKIAAYIKAVDKKNGSNFFDGFLDILSKKHIASALRLSIKCYLDSTAVNKRTALENSVKAVMAGKDNTPYLKQAELFEAQTSILVLLLALFSVSVADLNKPLDSDGA